ncbi:MAG: YeaH/YhbH family protein [Cellvibrionaceae bacterium]|nr:YeaH/YhbH family protein [Cellvibrionaceae bacterium]
MNYVIDRRLNSKQKSLINRQRFLQRYRRQIKQSVEKAVAERSITDIDRGEKISIPQGDTEEPIFRHGKGGYQQQVYPGNKEFSSGDRFKRPEGGAGQGSGQGQASDSGEGMDDFVFEISQAEFLDFMFEDLELPNLVKRHLAGDVEYKTHRAGFSDVGNPGQINIIRSMRQASARRLALGGKDRRKLKALKAQLHEAEQDHDRDRINTLDEQIEKLQKRLKRIPWLDDFDLKYNFHVKQPVPRSRAVMFCLMDVSGSMTQGIKDIAKRFFILLYLFLQRNYEHTDVVFIRHHTSAKEVDEEEFFYSRETGGTIVSSALQLMNEIVDARYPPAQWNIYGAQASDGDNWNDDSSNCSRILSTQLLSKVQHFSYIEITEQDHQSLWHEYSQIQHHYQDIFAMQGIRSAADIYPVFRQLFQRKLGQTAQGAGQ